MRSGRPRLVFVGVGSDESDFLRRLRDSMCTEGIPEENISLLVGHGSGTAILRRDIDSAMTGDTDLVVIGMSDPKPPNQCPGSGRGGSQSVDIEPEIYTGQLATLLDIPVAVYGNIPGAWQRAQRGGPFEELAPTTLIYLGSEKKTESSTRAAGNVFKDALIFGECNPSVYGDIALKRISREIHTFLLSRAAKRCE